MKKRPIELKATDVWLKLLAEELRPDKEHRIPKDLLIKLHGDVKWVQIADTAISTMRRCARIRIVPGNHDVVRAKPDVRIELPPGTRVARIMGALMTPRAYKKWVYPALAELHAEYSEALHNKETDAKLLWIRVRGIVSLVPGWLWGLIAGQVVSVIKWWSSTS